MRRKCYGQWHCCFFQAYQRAWVQPKGIPGQEELPRSWHQRGMHQHKLAPQTVRLKCFCCPAILGRTKEAFKMVKEQPRHIQTRQLRFRYISSSSNGSEHNATSTEESYKAQSELATSCARSTVSASTLVLGTGCPGNTF